MTSEEQRKDGSASRRRSRRGQHLSAEEVARRRQGRMLALQVLYEVDLTEHDPEEAMTRAFAEHDVENGNVIAHVQALVRGVLAQRDELDTPIAAAAPARSLHEQAAIERNVLRLAAYELWHEPDVPPKVAINEAVELAKQFGGENSGKFVNGVLRTLYEQSPPAAPAPARQEG